MNRTRRLLRAELSAGPRKMKCSRKRTLAPPSWPPSTSQRLELEAAGGEDSARDWPESGTTSSAETESKNEIGWRRILAQRQNGRRRRYLDSAEGSWSRGLIVLEAQAVKQGSQQRAVAQSQTDCRSGPLAQQQRPRLRHRQALETVLRRGTTHAGNEHLGRCVSLSAEVLSSRRSRSVSKLACAEGMERTLPRPVEVVRHDQCTHSGRPPVYGAFSDAKCEHLPAARPADAIARKVHRESTCVDAEKVVAVGVPGRTGTSWQNGRV